MNGKDKAKKSKRFINMYHNVAMDLKLNVKEYMLLDTMNYYSDRNVFSKGIVFLELMTGFSRNTIYKYITELIKKEHISKDGKIYNLHWDIKERIIKEEGTFIRIYKDWKTIEKDEINHYLLLYLIYSTSKRIKNRNALIGKKYIIKNALPTQVGNIHKTLRKLIDNELIIKNGINYYRLSEKAFDWFEKRRTCSNSA